jgi:prophage antirepressor-like protein
MALRVFQYGELTLRVLVREDGKIGALGNEFATSLVYANPWDAIDRHVVEPDWKCTLAEFWNPSGIPRGLLDRRNAGQQTVVLQEGIYALIAGSRLPVGRGYRRWLFGEVLPAIHSTGTYSVATSLEDAHDVQELIRQHVSASVCLNPVVGADDTWYHEREIGDVHEYRKPRDSIMHHARQAGPDSWRHLYELQPDCPRFQRKWRVYRKRVLVRTLLRGNKRKTKRLRRWALNDALPKGRPLRAIA